MSENEDLKETVDALTHGDVSKLVEQGLESQASGFQEFTDSIKKILTVVRFSTFSLSLYTYSTSKKDCKKLCKDRSRKHLTRAPFPKRPSDNEKL